MAENEEVSGTKVAVEEKKKSRKIGDIFSDYKTNSNIADAEVEKMNLIKKINTLEITMSSKEYIEIKEIWYFEKFLRQRFQFEQVHMIIKYFEGIYIKNIKDEWENLICYMTHKYPLMKPILLLKSDVEVEENNINVYMKIKGADFLKARKLDRELENVIYNLFGKKYSINIEERITEQEVNKYREKAKQIEQQAVQHAMEEIEAHTAQHNMGQEQGYSDSDIPPMPEGVFNDADYAMPTEDGLGYMPEVEEMQSNEQIIFGKPSKWIF